MWVFLLLVSATFADVSVHRFDGEKVFRVTPHYEGQVNILKNVARNMQGYTERASSKIVVCLNHNQAYAVNGNLVLPANLSHRQKELQNELSKRCLHFVDFWRPDSVEQVATEMAVDFRVEADKSSEVEYLLKKNGLDYEILIENVQAVLDRQSDNHFRATGHQYEKYNNWETIEAWTATIVNENPALVSRSEIGNTYEGRPIYVLKVGSPGVNKKAIFLDCGFHAREWISPAFCQWFVKEAVQGYGANALTTQLLDNLDFYVLPVVNIDGYVYTWTKSRMWRKTRSKNAGSNCIGTDPNRNFDAGWCSTGASTRPCDDTYCGSAPESEKETKALADFIRQNLSTIKAYLTVHSYSQILIYPYSYTYSVPKDNTELNSLAKSAVAQLASVYGTKYTYGPGATAIYPAAGGSDDWAYDQGIKYSFTFELRDTGRYGFLLPESQIRPTCEETLIAVKYIASYVLDHLY